MVNLEKEIASIKERNKRVESEKAWETSLSRRLLIAVLTYLTMVLFMSSINVADPMVNAIVPTIGFLLSTLSLPYFKSLWLKHYYRK